MAESTEENSSIRVIAVKLPDQHQLKVLSFAFLHALRSKYPDAEVHLITSCYGIQVLNLLPFKKFFYHEYPSEEIKTPFDVHRYCAQAKIYNTDLFISLSPSFLDSCLGLGLRAKKRVGFKRGLNGLVLNEVYPWLEGQHVIENFYQLINFDGKHLKIYSRELSPIIEDFENYIAINIGPLLDGKIDEMWVKVCSHFQNQNIILFMDISEDKFILNQNAFIKTLNPQNNYKFFIPENHIEIARMMSFSRGVITRNGAISALSAYVGASTLILNDRENPQIYGPFYFLSEIKIINLDFKAAGENMDRPARFDAEEVALGAHDFFKLYL